MEQLRIFVSHSSQDKAVADQFVRGLREVGADVWYDETNLGPGHLKDVIQRELELRPIFIVLLSKAAFASAWVKRETDWADELDDRDPTRLLLPVTIGSIERSDFSGSNGWLFLHSYKRIEAPNYQPYPLNETLERTVRILSLAPASTVLSSSQPQEVNDLLARAKALIGRQQFHEAVPFLEQVTQQAPERFEGWANLGRAYGSAGRPSNALQAAERALSLDSTHAYPWSTKGMALRDLKRPQEALVAFDQALTIDPGFAVAWSNKANVLGDLKRFEEALTCYDQALTLDPKLALAWNGKGNVLVALKRYQEALAAFDKALALNPKLAVIWTNKGMALVDVKQEKQALVAFERALIVDPQHVAAWYCKGIVLTALKRYEEALVAFEQTLTLDPNLADAWKNMAIALQALRRPAEAKEAERRAQAVEKRA